MDELPADHIDTFASEDSAAGSRGGRRRWLGIQFDCCSTYSRIYKNIAGTSYVGWCPRCGRPVRLKIGRDGTDARFFTAT